MAGSTSRWVRGSVGIVLAVCVLAVASALARPEVLVVERVEFDGAVRARMPALRHLADIRNGTRLWSVDPTLVSARVMRHPWVRAAETERSLDGTVRVRIQEHRPVALLAWGGRMLLVDEGGWPFLEADGTTVDLPVLLGVGPAEERRDPEIPRLVLRDALWLLDRLDAERLVPRHAVSDMTFEWHRGFTLRTTAISADRPPSEILFGFDDYGRQIRRLAKLVEQGLDWTEGIYVDLAPASVAIVRPLAEPGTTGDGAPSSADP